jgi:hypothetical protein
MMKINYLDLIPDEQLVHMVMFHQDVLNQFCMLLTLDLELNKTEG